MMRLFIKITMAFLVATTATDSFASGTYSQKPYLGMEIIQTNQKLAGNYGMKNFSKNPQIYSIFGGLELSSHVGVELGFGYQANSRKKSNISSGDQLGNGTVLDGSMTTSTYIRGTHPYVGLFLHQDYSLWRLQAMLGLSISTIKAQFKDLSEDGIDLEDSAIEESARNYRKTIAVPMVKVSAGYKITERCSIRASFNWYFNGFTIGSAENFASKIKVKNTAGIGLGLIYSL